MKIKKKLEEFKGKNPQSSSPFFVSRRAYEFAKMDKAMIELSKMKSDSKKSITKTKKR
jgi:hypothetical protein